MARLPLRTYLYRRACYHGELSAFSISEAELRVPTFTSGRPLCQAGGEEAAVVSGGRTVRKIPIGGGSAGSTPSVDAA